MKLNRLNAYALLAACFMQWPVSVLAIDTWPVSEEDPPAACDTGDAVYAATCYGRYCDKTKLSCANTNYPVLARSWTSNFSEEGTNNNRICGAQQIMTGISCAGRYCDNVSIECSTIPRSRHKCEWIGPYSEEQGYVDFGGRYANGLWCSSGAYCDNRWYLVCKF